MMKDQKYPTLVELVEEFLNLLEGLSKQPPKEFEGLHTRLTSAVQIFRSEWEPALKRLKEFKSSRAPNEANELSDAHESTTPQESCDSCECPDCLDIEFYQDKLECIKADLITLADFMARNDYANAKNILRDMLFSLEIFYTCFTEVGNARHH